MYALLLHSVNMALVEYVTWSWIVTEVLFDCYVSVSRCTLAEPFHPQVVAQSNIRTLASLKYLSLDCKLATWFPLSVFITLVRAGAMIAVPWVMFPRPNLLDLPVQPVWIATA